jgi:TrmH family RNA methyltransferase
MFARRSDAIAADDLVTSPHNAVLKRARKLGQWKFRDAQGAALVEGIGPVWQAHDSGARIEVLIVAPQLLTSEKADELVEGVAGEGAQVVRVGADAFSSIAARDNPSGLAAIVATPSRKLQDLVVEADSTFVALHEVGNPGNLGTIVRTVDGAGGAGVITVGDSTDPWHPSAVKASMGTVFGVPVCAAKGIDELLSWCSDNHVTVITTSARAESDYRAVDYPAPRLFLLGSEGRGLTDELIAAGDISVRIPMQGKASSLNLAVAAGILLYAATPPPPR